MHVPDGFLSPELTLPAYAAAAPLWVLGVRRHFGPSSVEALPVLGSLTALAFVLQTIMVPVPGGTSVHLVGMVLLAILFNPLVAFVAETGVLLLQVLLLGAGGITVLGVNALALGLVGPGAGWLVFRLLRRFGPRAAAFLGAWVGTQAGALAVAGALGLQHALDPAYFPVPFPVVAAALLLPSLTVVGVVEGAYTLLALSLLKRADLGGLAHPQS